MKEIRILIGDISVDTFTGAKIVNPATGEEKAVNELAKALGRTYYANTVKAIVHLRTHVKDIRAKAADLMKNIGREQEGFIITEPGEHNWMGNADLGKLTFQKIWSDSEISFYKYACKHQLPTEKLIRIAEGNFEIVGNEVRVYSIRSLMYLEPMNVSDVELFDLVMDITHNMSADFLIPDYLDPSKKISYLDPKDKRLMTREAFVNYTRLESVAHLPEDGEDSVAMRF